MPSGYEKTPGGRRALSICLAGERIQTPNALGLGPHDRLLVHQPRHALGHPSSDVLHQLFIPSVLAFNCGQPVCYGPGRMRAVLAEFVQYEPAKLPPDVLEHPAPGLI